MTDINQLEFGTDVRGVNAYSPDFSTYKFSANLSSGSEKTITVPSDYKSYIVSFSIEPGTKVWVSVNETAAGPSSSSFATTTSELNPGTRVVYAKDVLHFITTSTSSEVGVSFYANSIYGGPL